MGRGGKGGGRGRRERVKGRIRSQLGSEATHAPLGITQGVVEIGVVDTSVSQGTAASFDTKEKKFSCEFLVYT